MMDQLVERHGRFKDGYASLRVYRDILAAQADRLEAEEQDARYRAELHQKCSEIFKVWLDESLRKNVDSMADLATIALKSVIYDQDLEFRIRQDPKNNRISIRFALYEDSPGGTVEGDPMHSYGGGPAVILSLVLRLSVMARMRMGNLLLLDESMPALSDCYVPNFIAFIRQLVERTGVNILMVTHNPEFLANAHTAYEGYKDGCLKLRKLRTNGL